MLNDCLSAVQKWIKTHGVDCDDASPESYLASLDAVLAKHLIGVREEIERWEQWEALHDHVLKEPKEIMLQRIRESDEIKPIIDEWKKENSSLRSHNDDLLEENQRLLKLTRILCGHAKPEHVVEGLRVLDKENVSIRDRNASLEEENDKLRELVSRYFEDHGGRKGEGWCDCPACNFAALSGFGEDSKASELMTPENTQKHAPGVKEATAEFMKKQGR